MGSSSTKLKLPSELSESEIELIKLNTNMTHNEVCNWYKEFYEFSNGKQLDKHHFIKYYKDLLPYKGDSEEFCKLVFNVLKKRLAVDYFRVVVSLYHVSSAPWFFGAVIAFDTDNSTQLDFSEVIVGFTILSKGDINKRLNWMFNIYDQNNDKFIDYEELKLAIKAILAMTNKDFTKTDHECTEIAQNILQSLDKDTDHKISLEEFIDGTTKNQVLRDLMCPKDL